MKAQNKLAEKEFFNQQTNWDLFADWRYRSYIDFFLKYSNLKPKAKILDLGCGSGAFGKYFLKDGFQVVGLDISLGLLKKARERFPVICADAEEIPFSSASFDAVIGGGNYPSFSKSRKFLR